MGLHHNMDIHIIHMVIHRVIIQLRRQQLRLLDIIILMDIQVIPPLVVGEVVVVTVVLMEREGGILRHITVMDHHQDINHMDPMQVEAHHLEDSLIQVRPIFNLNNNNNYSNLHGGEVVLINDHHHHVIDNHECHLHHQKLHLPPEKTTP